MLDLAPPRGGGPTAFDAAEPRFTSRTPSEAEAELGRLSRSGMRVLVTFGRRGDLARALARMERLRAVELEPGEAPEPGTIGMSVTPVRTGMVSRQLGLAVVPEERMLRRRRPSPQRGPVVGRRLQSFLDLKVGDHVVHEDHGIGRLTGFETRTVAGLTRDYLALAFADGDRLYVPHDQLDRVTRYVGADGSPPALSKLGGKAWDRMKSRARAAVREMAGELIALYEARAAAVGYAFPADDELSRELERSFRHRETPDQQRAIDAVADDMERPRPMDRLICGDVGFGKTEIAMRAAFKAAAGGKQVLMLVPTTILAQQHLATFRERFGDLPVSVDMVNRFRTPAETREVLARYREGTPRHPDRHPPAAVDGRAAEGPRPGDRRRGAALRRRAEGEPAPAAAAGGRARDERHADPAHAPDLPVGPARHQRHRDAAARPAPDRDPRRRARRGAGGRGAAPRERPRRPELLPPQPGRDDRRGERRGCGRCCPELRIVTAHGQMREHELEEVMLAFVRGEADVLVATSIIESGLDIPQANTLVVERADQLGLSQLYQIRGRVGRSDVTAHAYLLYPDAASLSREAASRLRALADYTELGSGLRIAMRDLEIRGAGNLLGDEQSGHVAAIGFELYLEMLNDAVMQGQGQETARARRAGRHPRLGLHPERVRAARGRQDRPAPAHRARRGARGRRRRCATRSRTASARCPQPVEALLAVQRVRVKLRDAGASQIAVRSGRRDDRAGQPHQPGAAGPARGRAEGRLRRQRAPRVAAGSERSRPSAWPRPRRALDALAGASALAA